MGSDLITEYMEAASFLEWLLSENFILMGVRMGDSGWESTVLTAL